MYNKKENELKITEFQGKTYMNREVDSEYHWIIHPAKYWFLCDKPTNPLTFLGFGAGSNKSGNYNLVFFKEKDSDNYYKLNRKCTAFGWDGCYDGEWAWVSDTHPYPNTPINAEWELSATYDSAKYPRDGEIEYVCWNLCDKPSEKLNLIGMWRFENKTFNKDYPRTYVHIRFYRQSNDDSSTIYRNVQYSKEYHFTKDSLIAEEWYKSTGRQWPGATDGSYNNEHFVVDGLIETNTVTLLTGPLWSGKSHLVGQLCACINNGTPFLGMTTKFGKALHIDCDTNDTQFGRLYKQIEDFYGPKTDSSYVVSFGEKVTGGLTADELLESIEDCCMKNKDISLVAIDSIDSLNLDTFVKRRKFIFGLRRIASSCKVAVVYTCTADSVEKNAVDMAEDCDPDGLYAEMSYFITGIIPDEHDDEVLYVHFDNKFDIHDLIKCRKNAATNYCFDVECKVE